MIHMIDMIVTYTFPFVQMSILFLGGCVSFPLVKHDKWPCSSCEYNCSMADVRKYIEKPMKEKFDFLVNMVHNQEHRRKSVATWDYK